MAKSSDCALKWSGLSTLLAQILTEINAQHTCATLSRHLSIIDVNNNLIFTKWSHLHYFYRSVSSS
jgi:hypothetical protein